MTKNRLEAFSDGVFAILLTVLVLELKAPHGSSLSDLSDMYPIFLGYILSFIYIGIYWSNHHHLLQAANQVHGKILWANLHLLFWLSLVPFTTGWMGEYPTVSTPTALYGAILFGAAVAYGLLERLLIKTDGEHSKISRALKYDLKAKLSPLAYFVAVALAFWWPLVAQVLFVVVALVWLVPDRRIERVV